MLTNNSIYTPRDLRRLLNSGLDIPVESIWTSALATAVPGTTSAPRAAPSSSVRPG
jgi:NagD protein